MKVTIKYFAMAREQLGREEELLDLPQGMTIDQLRRRLQEAHPELGDFLSRVIISLNREYGRRDDIIHEGDELALIPPVGGGAECRITEQRLELEEVIRQVAREAAGAVVTFTGCVRDHSEQGKVEALEYEAYREMAEESMKALKEDILKRWPMVRVALKHRIGRLEIGEAAVVIALSAPHRKEAFQACEYAIDQLKERVPIWKKEYGENGALWVSNH